MTRVACRHFRDAQSFQLLRGFHAGMACLAFELLSDDMCFVWKAEFSLLFLRDIGQGIFPGVTVVAVLFDLLLVA